MNLPSPIVPLTSTENSSSLEILIPISTTRSAYDIVFMCYSTMIICVWSALHINIPTWPRGFWKTSFCKLAWIILGILMPDLLLLVALCEFVSAVLLLQDAYGYSEFGLRIDELGWFQRTVLRIRRFNTAVTSTSNVGAFHTPRIHINN